MVILLFASLAKTTSKSYHPIDYLLIYPVMCTILTFLPKNLIHTLPQCTTKLAYLFNIHYKIICLTNNFIYTLHKYAIFFTYTHTYSTHLLLYYQHTQNYTIALQSRILTGYIVLHLYFYQPLFILYITLCLSAYICYKIRFCI